jgi:hypothetical protein
LKIFFIAKKWKNKEYARDTICVGGMANMTYIISFGIFFVVYFIMSLIINSRRSSGEKKDLKTIANYAFFIGMIYILAQMLFRSFGNLFNK